MCADEPPVPLPITGELDLHTFRPSDAGTLIPAYLAECLARGIFPFASCMEKAPARCARRCTHCSAARPSSTTSASATKPKRQLGRNHRDAAARLERFKN